MMKLSELRQQGYQALIEALGVVGAIKFLQQLEVGYGDYTKERHQWLDKLNFEDLESFLEQKKIES
uniref:hypothetical protein n=2 Tax=Cyanothece sp. BG0011 TaxID=2082950 RepID=UPI0018E579CD|nr:hypothetical protein [Cyanothece sp. BG0011]